MNSGPEKPKSIDRSRSLNLPDIDPNVASALDAFAHETIASFQQEPYVAMPPTHWSGSSLTDAFLEEMQSPSDVYPVDRKYGLAKEWLARRSLPKTSDKIN